MQARFPGEVINFQEAIKKCDSFVSPDEARRIDDPDIRRLVHQRYAEVCNGEPYERDIHGR